MRRILTGLVATLALVAGWELAGSIRLDSRTAPGGSAGIAALLARGLGELENQRDTEAEATFAELARQAPGEPAGPANRALALARLGRFDEAFVEVGAALRRAPDWPELLVLRADLNAAAGRSDAAIADLERVARAAPDDPAIRYRLFEQASLAGDRETARRALDRLATLRPESVPVLVEAARQAAAEADRPATTTAVLRIRELAEATGGAAEESVAAAIDAAIDALESGEAPTTRIAVERLANVLRGTPLYQLGLRELASGMLGDPVERLRARRAVPGFGAPRPTRWAPVELGSAPGGAVTAADFDGDGRADLARVVLGPTPGLEITSSREPAATTLLPLAFVPRDLSTVDLDDDGPFDLLAWGEGGSAYLRGDGAGGFEDATAAWGLGAGARAVAAIDFDLDGDLDLALFGGAFPAGSLLRSSLAGPLIPTRALPPFDAAGARVARVTDHDQDGDPDLVVLTDSGVLLLDNLRQGLFALRTAEAGLEAAPGGFDLTAGDFDGDRRPDLAIATGDGVALVTHLGARFAPPRSPVGAVSCSTIATVDADFDGRLDLACGGRDGAALLQAGVDARFEVVDLPGEAAVEGVAAADLDGDGDLDLALSGDGGLARLDNLEGNLSNWLAVRLAGLPEGNGKNNRHGLHAIVELSHRGAVQLREVDSETIHFGLGDVERADRLRVIWTNGVPQNRLGVAADQLVVEEQVLKGSCPFLYAWNGERVEFVTDLLWNSPLGLPLAPGVWAPADPEELVRIDGAAADARGRYLLTITEELWEAAFFDRVRLWVVDHPAEVEVASTLKVVPGAIVEDRVVASRDLRPLVAAVDGRGRDVTSRLRARDDVYADGFERLRFQGATRPWALELDLGEAPAAPIRLHLDAWIFPADASLNLAIAQRPDLQYLPPRLDMETGSGWRTLVDSIGFPAGKTKTMVVDTPPLPAGVHRLRIVSSLWLGFDRVAWTTHPDDGSARVVARLDPAVARLGFGGFAAVRRAAPNGPHRPDFAHRSAASPWLPFPGHYTRFGDVRELLLASDDRSVVLAAGDEMRLEFDAAALPPPPPGFARTLFLESHGWDKDADRNTWQAAQLEPLPFRAMRGYPDPTGAIFPDDELHRAYVRDWLTREIRALRADRAEHPASAHVGGGEE